MDKVALITGGSRGIGLGVSTALAQEGWNIVVCGRRDESEVHTLENVYQFNIKVLYVQADISKEEDRTRLIKKINDYFGRLDLLVNNA